MSERVKEREQSTGAFREIKGKRFQKEVGGEEIVDGVKCCGSRREERRIKATRMDKVIKKQIMG